MQADLIAAWRGLRRGRRAAVTAILALGVGVGACVAAGAIATAGLLRPLPFPDPDELLAIRPVYEPTGALSSVRAEDFDKWHDGLAASFMVAGSSPGRDTLRGADGPRQVRTTTVVGAYFEIFGDPFVAGLPLREDMPDVVAVSRTFALGLSGSAGAAVGQPITLGTRTYRIVGVVADTMTAIQDSDVWISGRTAGDPGGFGRFYNLVARRQSGISMEAARAQVATALPAIVPENQRSRWRADVRSLQDSLMGDSRPVLLAVLAAAFLLLCAACANTALLLVNQAIARRREFAVKLALGAGRGRLIRVAFLEAALVCSTGTALGVWLALLATRALQTDSGLAVPDLALSSLTAPVAEVAAGVWLFLVLVCGAAPVIVSRSSRLVSPLRSTGVSRAGRRLRGTLVMAQLAMAIILLVGTGLLGRTLWQVSHVDTGLDRSAGVLTAGVPIGQSLHTDPDVREARMREVLRGVRRLPAVESAGFGTSLPPSTGGMIFTIRYTSDARDETRMFDMVSVTEGYLEALGARLVSGRFFSEADLTSGEAVAILSESALRHLGAEAATSVGGTINLAVPSADGQRRKPRLIGIVQDIRYAGMDTAARGSIYVPWHQQPLPMSFLIVRTPGDPMALTASIRRLLHDADPSLPAGEVRSLEAEVQRTLEPRTARASLVGTFAAGALLLAAIGLFGSLIQSVVERQRELAIRAAIGATPGRLRLSVLRQGLLLALAGIVMGLGLSAMAGRAMQSLLLDVTPYDPITYAVCGLLLLVTSLIACDLPSRRAAAANPVELLRSE